VFANVDHALGHDVLKIDAFFLYAFDYYLYDARYIAMVYAQNDFVIAVTKRRGEKRLKSSKSKYLSSLLVLEQHSNNKK
jgi:hypothetical protein